MGSLTVLGSARPLAYQASLEEDIEGFVSPGSRVIASGEFVPKAPEVDAAVFGCAQFLEGSAGHAKLEFYYGDPDLAPLTPDFEGDPDPGVNQVQIGAVSSRSAPFGRRFRIEGLVPGQPVAWETTVLIVGGGYRLLGLPIAGGYWASSVDPMYGVQQAGRRPGEFIVATRGANRVMVIRSNHYAYPAQNDYLGSVVLASAVAPTRIVVAPDGTKSFSPIFETDRLAVVTTATPPTHVEVALPASRTDPADIAITPDGSTVWVICFLSGHAVKFNVAAGTFDDTKTVNLGAASSALYATINPAGTRLYVVMNATRTIKVIDLTLATPVVIATIGPIGSGAIQNLVIAPDGATGYIVVGANIYSINMATNAVSAGIAHGVTIPGMLSMMSDGRTLMIANQAATGDQLHQFNLPSLTKYHEWPNALNGQSPLGINQICLTPNGSLITQHGTGVNNIWPGGNFSLRPSLADFYGDFLDLHVSPAVDSSA